MDELLKNYCTSLATLVIRKSFLDNYQPAFDNSFHIMGDFDLVARMPWESGNSWVVGIERGISGFSNYMYFTKGEGRFAARSRSGKAVQSKKEINAGTFRPTKYITEILDNYRKRLVG